VKQTAYLLGIVAAEAGGLRNNFGSMTKPFHAGRAAENGVVAADLAALGWTASEEILEARSGFFHAAGGGFNPDAIVNRLGKPWTFADPGISIKPFPSGSLTHPAMGEMLRLVRENNINAADVEKVDMGGNSGMMNALLHHRPKNALNAKFSMEFCMAILLLERKAGLHEFTDEVVQRADVQELLQRVNFYVDPEAEKAGLNKMTSLIKVHLKSGKTIDGRADFAKGHPFESHELRRNRRQVSRLRRVCKVAKGKGRKRDSDRQGSRQRCRCQWAYRCVDGQSVDNCRRHSS
jgi:2-methylcitrate dehydratase PrpD